MSSLSEYIIKHRRHLHQFPEVGFECKKSSAYIKNELNLLGVDEIHAVGNYSLVAVVRNGKGSTIGLRADFDALEIEEATDLSFKSKNKGKMHACGHDAHTAMLLGACKYLVTHKDEWHGCVMFIFQEAEEGPDPGGAVKIVESGVLKDCEEFFALHVSARYEVGEVAINYGEAMAAADTLELRLIGKGCHAALPEEGIDPILMQAEYVMGAHTIVSRKISPMDRAVITIAKVQSGTTHNVIPEDAKLMGTVRSFSPSVREKIEHELETLAQSIALRHSGKYEFHYIRGYDPVINSKDSTDTFVEIVSKRIGKDNLIILDTPMAGAEDFSAYINYRKGALAWLGIKQRTVETYNIHHPKFNLNEDALIVGANIFIDIVKGRK